MEPRLEPEEIEFFQELMRTKAPGTKMVEWGSGGSTMMFLPHFDTGSLVSVEHNQEWRDKVVKAVTEANFKPEILQNFTYCWRPPHQDNALVSLGFHGYGIPYEECPTFAANYINPEVEGVVSIWDADVFFIDGICRGAILATLQKKAINRSARIFLHDAHGPEQRESWYRWSTDLYSERTKVGPTLLELRL